MRFVKVVTSNLFYCIYIVLFSKKFQNSVFVFHGCREGERVMGEKYLY